MDAVAALVLVVVLAVSVWALVAGRRAADQLADIWNLKPWGRQVYVDFLGLEVILALWILEDASRAGTWTAAIVSIVAMPVFGAMSAAAYWLLR